MSDNKQKRAVALGYDPTDEAPRVLATGTGALAEKIIDKAKESEVPIHRDDKLAQNLANLDVGEYIPPELYEVVAEILVFVNSVDNKLDRIKDKVR
ncbi:MAG: EscU/YscU/HrcU family type III secretion system export apparatus switch protein [Lachnospiraceae bacterium]|nr:EscU/YscU/HrcU family type III secretion system export apparatus switch protein [Lachnospiraceae bacterium]